MILNYRDWSNRVQYVTITRKDNDVSDHIDAVYAENDTELSWPIGLGVDYDEIQIGQQCD